MERDAGVRGRLGGEAARGHGDLSVAGDGEQGNVVDLEAVARAGRRGLHDSKRDPVAVVPRLVAHLRKGPPATGRRAAGGPRSDGGARRGDLEQLEAYPPPRRAGADVGPASVGPAGHGERRVQGGSNRVGGVPRPAPDPGRVAASAPVGTKRDSGAVAAPAGQRAAASLEVAVRQEAGRRRGRRDCSHSGSGDRG